MKTFNFKFKPYVIVLLILTLVISLISLALNVYNLVIYFSIGGIKIISYAIICLATTVIATFILSVLFYSKYKLCNKYLVCNLGFYKTKVKISKISEIINFSAQNKLIIYFNESDYSVIVIAKENYENFISTILKINPRIVFSINNTAKI
jgi:hypothetical protein